jgi:hypothetical protein
MLSIESFKKTSKEKEKKRKEICAFFKDSKILSNLNKKSQNFIYYFLFE